MAQYRRVDEAKKTIPSDLKANAAFEALAPQPTAEDLKKSNALRDRVQAIREMQQRKKDQSKSKLL